MHTWQYLNSIFSKTSASKNEKNFVLVIVTYNCDIKIRVIHAIKKVFLGLIICGLIIEFVYVISFSIFA